MSDSNNLPPIRVTVEIPSELVLEMQKQSIRGGIEGAAALQGQLVQIWMNAGAQAMEPILSAMKNPFRLPGPGSSSGRG